MADPTVLKWPAGSRSGMCGASAAQISYNVTQLSFRQSVTPRDLQGRTNAAQRFMVWGTMPITIIFTMAQMPLVMRHSLEPLNKDEK